MSITIILLLPVHYYHIYNHGNANDNIFRNDDNYNYFLNRYGYYINPVADTCAYCLLPNHFHFVIQIKSEKDLIDQIKIKDAQVEASVTEALSDFINQQFSNLFNAYSKAFNKMFSRNGKLFRLPFKRKELDNDLYFLKAIHYVHANAVHHAFVKEMIDWKYSSIHAYLSDKQSAIKRNKVLDLFGGVEGFKMYHQQPIDVKYKIEMDF
jgi:REP element-mobilizing transposase RayT